MTNVATRPDVFQCTRATDFVRELAAHLRVSDPRLSLRQRVQRAGAPCSVSLLSQIVNRKRALTFDQLPHVSRVLGVSAAEREHLTLLLRAEKGDAQALAQASPRRARVARNHLLSFWLNPYVKDLVGLPGFRPDAKVLQGMLRGLATLAQIRRALGYLQREGFLRRRADGSWTADEPVSFSSDGVSSLVVRNFHRRALKVADGGLRNLATSELKSTTVLVPAGPRTAAALREMVDDFQRRLTSLMESQSEAPTELLQITVQLTPVARAGGENSV